MYVPQRLCRSEFTPSSRQQPVHTCTMQHGTQASETDPMTSARRLQVLSALADADLATIRTLSVAFSRSFPVLSWSSNSPISLNASHSYEYRFGEGVGCRQQQGLACDCTPAWQQQQQLQRG
jgi:hypothetical protein